MSRRHALLRHHPLCTLLSSALHTRMSNEKFSIGRSVATRTNARCNIRSVACCNIRTKKEQHQNKVAATSNRLIMQQRNITYCNIRTKATAMRDAISEQKKRPMHERNMTCCNIKTRLLQYQIHSLQHDSVAFIKKSAGEEDGGRRGRRGPTDERSCHGLATWLLVFLNVGTKAP
jgi:ribosomal protein L24